MVVRIVKGDDSTLHLPRILCLHGGGTNACIFRMQCRVLERSLWSTFRLVYAQAPFPAQPGSDVISVYKQYGPFKGWLPSTPEDLVHSAQETVDQIDEALAAAMCADDLQGATGEWVALLGFSQGAKIAASILYSQQVLRQQLGRNAAVWPDFRFAVLLAGQGPLVWLMPEMPMPPGLVDVKGRAAPTSTATNENILRVPTTHIHGLNDPGLELHRILLNRYCDPDSVMLYEWDGNHRVPIKTKDVSALVDKIFSMAQETGVLSFWG